MIRIGGVYTTFCQEKGDTLQKYRDRNGVAIGVAIYRMGNRPDAKIPEKWERKWKMAPGPKWPKNGRRNGKMDPEMGFLAIFPFRRPFFGHLGPGAIFHFLAHLSGIFASGRFPILYMATPIAKMGDVSRYFSKVSGSGVDVTLLKQIEHKGKGSLL